MIALFGIKSNAQSVYSKTLFSSNSEFFIDAIKTADGGFVVISSWTIVKLDKNGSPIWEIPFEEDVNFHLIKIVQTSLGDYILLSSAIVYGSYRIMVMNISADGVLGDSKTLYYGGSNRVSDLEIDQQGGVLLFGSGCLNGNFIVHIDKNLNILYQKVHRFTGGPTFSRSVIRNKAGNYVVAGYQYISAESTNALEIFEVDSVGNMIWYNFFDFGGKSAGANEIVELSDGGYAIAAHRNLTDKITTSEAILLKVDSVGKFVWSKLLRLNGLNSSVHPYSHTVVELSDKTLLFGTVGNLPIICKVSTNGDLEFIKEVANDNLNDALKKILPICNQMLVAFTGEKKTTFTIIDEDAIGFCNINIMHDSTYNFIDTTFSTITNSASESPLTFTEGTFSYQEDTIYTAATKELCNNIDTSIVCTPSPENITSINIVDSNIEFYTYPNPFSNKLYVEVQLASIIYITDVIGKFVYSNTIDNGSITIDTETLKEGIYFVKVVNGNGTITKKVIKN